MPISRIRRKRAYTPPPSRSTARVRLGRAWVAPLMLTLFALGLLWIVTFYVSGFAYPIESIRNWNLAVGFGLIAAGFVVSTQWK